MANPNRDKGLRFQLECRKFAQARGFPTAHNLSGAGVEDKGDVMLCDRLVLECKSYKATGGGRMQESLLRKWLNETEFEARNLGVEFGVLVVKQDRRPTGQALCYVPRHTYHAWTGGKCPPLLIATEDMTALDDVVVITYQALLALLRELWGR